MSKPVCVIVGVGAGNGAAFARKFSAEGYQVALLARNERKLNTFAEQIANSRAYACDVMKIEQVKEVFTRIQAEMGVVKTLIYNAGTRHAGTVDSATVEAVEMDWRVNTLGCLIAAQQVVPGMRDAGGGNIIVIGATASLQSGPDFLPFDAAKAAQRSVVQSIAKQVGKDNIHVSYIIIDSVVDMPLARQFLPDKPDDFFAKPDEIAETVYYLTQQPKSAWTFQLDVRPFSSNW